MAPRWLTLPLSLALLVAACDMRDFDDETAEIEVSTVTEGDYSEEYAYTLTLNGAGEQTIGANDRAVYVRLEPASYTVALAAIPPNCIVTGGNERTLTVRAGETADVTFQVACADVGANLLFESDRGGDLDLYTIDFASGLVRPVVTAPGPDYDAAVSPDGTWIYFTSRRAGNLEIYRTRPDGTGLRNLTQHPASDTEPAVSPDGTRIAFTSTRDGTPQLYVMNADGSGVTRVTSEGTIDRQPAWLSETQILFSRQGTIPRLYLLDLQTLQWTFFSLEPTGGSYPAVSPDGTRIAYSGLVNGNAEIFIADARGLNPRQLTDHPADDLAPVFSPDGTRIAFASSREGSGDIFLMDLEGNGLINLTADPAFDFKPVFMTQP